MVCAFFVLHVDSGTGSILCSVCRHSDVTREWIQWTSRGLIQPVASDRVKQQSGKEAPQSKCERAEVE